MFGSISIRKLFHFIFKIYFVVSLSIFLWFGHEYGILFTVKNKHIQRVEVSILTRQASSNSKDQTVIDAHFRQTASPTGTQYLDRNISSIGGNEYIIGEMGIKERNGFISDKNSFDADKVFNPVDIEVTSDDEYEIEESHDQYQLNETENDQEEIDEVNPDSKQKWEISFQRWKELVAKQNQLYSRPLYKRIPNQDVFYISAVTTNLSRDPYLTGNDVNIAALNGWQGKKNVDTVLYCCFERGDVSDYSVVYKRNIWDKPDIKLITTTQFLCNTTMRPVLFSETYVGLSLTPTCDDVEYINLEVETRPPSSTNATFGVCGKILYNDFPAVRLIEWFEINKMLGVDKISLFIYNITSDAKAVMNYYHKEGLVTFQEFDFPVKLKYPRYLGQKYMMAYMDEQVTVFHCTRMLRRFTYMAVIDVDEFIMPKMIGRTKTTNLKDMMARLLGKYRKAAGFTLMTSIFVLDWNSTHRDADFIAGQYTLRTKPIWDRRKSVIVSERVHLSSVWTHDYRPKPTFRRMYTLRSEALVYHYRKCRSDWLKRNTCFKRRKQHIDTSMKKLLPKAISSFRSKRKLLLNY